MTKLESSFLQRVLTAEYIDGCKISDVQAIKKMGLTLKDVSIMFDLFLEI